MNDEPIVNAWGLARRLRLPRTWLLSEAQAGRLPCLRIGGHTVFNVDAVRRALAKRASRRKEVASR